MKRILAVLLAILMLFASCNKSSGNSDETKGSDATEVIATAAEDTTGATESQESEEPTEDTDVSEPTAQGSTPLLYKVTDDDSTVWLMGTIHVGRESFYPLPDYVTNAYEGADSLAIECDVAAFEKDLSAQYKALMKLIYTDRSKISDHLSEDTYTKAKELLSEYGVYHSALDYYMPVLWWQTIYALMTEKTSLSDEYGVDNHFYELAKNDGKPILEVESAILQYEMLAGFSEELQVALLEDTIDYTPKMMDEENVALADLWAAGDEKAIIERVFTDEIPEADKEIIEEYNYKLITERNIGMADFAEDVLDEDNEVFICVGLAHVVGEGGMADLLRERGYTVEIVK